MKLMILSDSHYDAGLGLDQILEFNERICNKINQDFYGEEVQKIVIILMCRAPYVKFKQRKRYSKKDKAIYHDIMLDYILMKESDINEKKAIIGAELIKFPDEWKKRKFEDFNISKLQSDLEKTIRELV